MNKPIQVGDLVQVVKPGCNDEHVGLIFVVHHINTLEVRCHFCKTWHLGHLGAPLACQKGMKDGFEFARLKRFPPLDELEGQRSEDELPLPTITLEEYVERIKKEIARAF